MNKTEEDRFFEAISDVDISENYIWEYDQEVLRQLLIDHSVSDHERHQLVESYIQEKRKEPEGEDLKEILHHTANITWATHDYEERGEGYGYFDKIEPKRIIGQNGRVIMPRVLKDSTLQVARAKDKAEVFTPSWICNAQNNLIDEAWFGKKDVFNTEITNADGTHDWQPTEKVAFGDDPKKTWKKYVSDNRMEITCGEAPYLVSRYDTTTGQPIPLNKRVGLLDRKLRVISENCNNSDEWLEMARRAYQHTYGYEWQGDNLLLAREALLYSFIEYYMAKFPGKHPGRQSIIGIARIISWNVWQMDGLRMVVPDSCDRATITNLFGEKEKIKCKACETGDRLGHIGIPCLIRDWNKKKDARYEPKLWQDQKASPWQKITFTSLFTDRSESDDNEE